jgi:hypothetical protein
LLFAFCLLPFALTARTTSFADSWHVALDGFPPSGITKRVGSRSRSRRHGLLEGDDAEDEGDGLAALAASAVSGTTPPAGPEWRRCALPFGPETGFDEGE